MSDARAVPGATMIEGDASGDGSAPSPGRRERKRRELRERLCAAALELFVEHGYETTTMEQIGERADVARATVFNYFPQKVGFLEEWGMQRRASVAALLDQQQTALRPAAEHLRAYLRALAALNEGSRRESAVLLDAAAHFGRLFQDPSLEIDLARVIRAGQDAGTIESAIDPRQVGSLLAAGYFSTVLQWAAAESVPFDLCERLDAMLDLVLPALQGARDSAP